jgi:membrane fusion protein, copper/silver efflux system
LPEALVVPASAIMDTGKLQVVFVKQGKGTFVPRAVQLGATAKDNVMVFKGVQAGEQVVVNANFMLDSESRLKAVIEQGGVGGGHQH